MVSFTASLKLHSFLQGYVLRGFLLASENESKQSGPASFKAAELIILVSINIYI